MYTYFISYAIDRISDLSISNLVIYRKNRIKDEHDVHTVEKDLSEKYKYKVKIITFSVLSVE